MDRIVYDRMAAHDSTHWWYRARRDIEGYLLGLHTTAYIRPFEGGASLAHRLADSIAWSIRDVE